MDSDLSCCPGATIESQSFICKFETPARRNLLSAYLLLCDVSRVVEF